MAHRYFCEFCGQRFHSAVAAIECARTTACRGFGFPPPAIVGTWKVRGCAIILATTAADMIRKSPAGKTQPEVRKMADDISKWARRAEEALCANTPLSLGKRTRVHNGLVDFVWDRVWRRSDAIPNLHALDLALRYAEDAKEFVRERIEKELHRKFWFQDEHPEWLLYDVINVPLAVYITQMKVRNQVSKKLSEAIAYWGNPLRTGQAPAEILETMLRHCWQDEFRSWNFMIGALKKAITTIEAKGTPVSLDLSAFDADEKYGVLLAYIWDDPVEEDPRPDLKLWLINERFWVAAVTRQEAKDVLTRDSGHIPKTIRGIIGDKKLFGPNGEEETARDILDRTVKAQLIGVET